MSFRQDRTNPSTAISNWRGRSDTPKAWPSTAVSTWMNGGLFGGGGEMTGGTRDESHGDGYFYEIFYTSGTMEVSGPMTIDLLVCGGGGSAADAGTADNSQGGGGGAGWTGVDNLEIAAGSFNVTIGAGGAIPVGVGYGSEGGDTSVPILLQSGTTVLFGSGGGGSGGRGGNASYTSGGTGRNAPTVNDGTSYASNVVGSPGGGGGGGNWIYNASGSGGAGGNQQNTGGPGAPASVTIYYGASGGTPTSAAWPGATGASGTQLSGRGSPDWQPPDGAGWKSYPAAAGANYTIFCCGGAAGYSGLLPSGNSYLYDATSGSGNSQTYNKSTSGVNGTLSTTSGGIIIARWAV